MAKRKNHLQKEQEETRAAQAKKNCLTLRAGPSSCNDPLLLFISNAADRLEGSLSVKWQHIRSSLITASEESFSISGVHEKERLSGENLNERQEANPETTVDKSYYNVISGTVTCYR